MRPRATVLLLSAAAAIALAAIVSVLAWTRDRSLDRARTVGIRIGYAVEPPYAFVTDAGEVTGEAPEVARVVAKRLGIRRVTWEVSEFGALLPELIAGRFDVVAAGVFITPEREREVSFSAPTFRVRQALLVQRGNPLGLHTYGDAVSRPEVRVAAIDGSVEAGLLRTLGLQEDRLVLVPDARAGQRALQAGLVGGLALSSPAVRWLALNDRLGSTEPASPFAAPATELVGQLGHGAVVFQKGDVALRRAWNRELAAFLGTPEHQRLVGRFGFTSAELAQPPASEGEP